MTIPVVNKDTCTLCEACVEACPLDILLAREDEIQVVGADECVQCNSCVNDCPTGALTLESA